MFNVPRACLLKPGYLSAFVLAAICASEATAQAQRDSEVQFLTPAGMAANFDEVIRPFLSAHCLQCHDAEEPEGMLDLSGFRSANQLVQNFATWELVVDRVRSGEMPPEDAGDLPTARRRAEFIGSVEELQADYARRHAGDPGEVLTHRLSSAEYNYTIRDLTGVDMQPASEFPIDPANEAGFDNSGESLNMTPALLNKYMSAARMVADHLLFKPDGLAFAPHAVVTDTDRDKYCVRRIVDFYQRQNTDIADYFFAAWQLQQVGQADDPALEQLAAQENLSANYLRLIRDTLASPENHAGPIEKIRTLFAELPNDLLEAQKGCRAMRDYVIEIRGLLAFDFPHLRVDEVNRGSQPLVLWRNRQMASHRLQLNHAVLQIEKPEGLPLVEAVPQHPQQRWTMAPKQT